MVVFASLFAEQKLQEMPELPLFSLNSSDTRQEQSDRPVGGQTQSEELNMQLSTC